MAVLEANNFSSKTYDPLKSQFAAFFLSCPKRAFICYRHILYYKNWHKLSLVSKMPNTLTRLCGNIDYKCKIIYPFKIYAKAGIQEKNKSIHSGLHRQSKSKLNRPPSPFPSPPNTGERAGVRGDF